VIALATNAVLHERVYDVSSVNFDLRTGAQILVPDESRSDGENTTWALIDLVSAQNLGAPAATIAALQADYDRADRIQKASLAQARTLDPAEVLIELLIAQNRGADPAIVKAYEDKYNAAMGRTSLDDAVRERISRWRQTADTSSPLLPRPGQLGFGVGPAPPLVPSAREIAVAALLTSPLWVVLALRSSWGRALLARRAGR